MMHPLLLAVVSHISGQFLGLPDDFLYAKRPEAADDAWLMADIWTCVEGGQGGDVWGHGY